jgi:hypothetical protein
MHRFLGSRPLERGSGVALLLAACLAAPASAEGANKEMADSGLSAIVSTRINTADGLDSYKGSCKPRTARLFQCRFRASRDGKVWQARGRLRYRSDGLFAYRLRGRKEVCGNDGCHKVKVLRWRGVTAWG